MVEPAAGLDVVQVLEDEYRLSRCQECRIAGISRSALYKLWAEDAFVKDVSIIEALNGVLGSHGHWRFWECFHWLRFQNHCWNQKHIYRMYCYMKLSLPHKA